MYKIRFEIKDIPSPEDGYRWKSMIDYEPGEFDETFATFAEAKDALKEILERRLAEDDEGCGDADCSYQLEKDIDDDGTASVLGVDWDGDWLRITYTITKL